MARLVKPVESWLYALRTIQTLQLLHGDPVVVREIGYPGEEGYYKDSKGTIFLHSQAKEHERVFVVGVTTTEEDECIGSTFIVGDHCLYHHALHVAFFADVPPRQNFTLRIDPGGQLKKPGVARFHGWSVNPESWSKKASL